MCKGLWDGAYGLSSLSKGSFSVCSFEKFVWRVKILWAFWKKKSELPPLPPPTPYFLGACGYKKERP